MKHLFKMISLSFVFSFFLLSEQQGALNSCTLENLPSTIHSLLEKNGNSVDEPLLIKSHALFFHLFDPHKIYLLENELSPFLHPSKKIKFLTHFNNNNFSTYSSMYAICQRAIERARKIRATCSPSSTTPSPTCDTYAKSEKELTSRIHAHYLLLIKERTNISWYQAQTIVDKELHIEEAHFMGQKNLAPHILHSIISSIDFHSKLMDTDRARCLREKLTKESFGTGVHFKFSNGNCLITKIIKGSPAQGKLLPQDLLISLNSKLCNTLTEKEISLILNGGNSSSIHIVTRRDTTDRSLTIKKQAYIIQEERVELHALQTSTGTVGILTIPSLYKGRNVSSHDDLIAKLSKSSNLSGLLIDLRENRGGYITEAVAIVGEFITTGVVTRTLYSGRPTIIFRDLDKSLSYKGPIVILTSNNTASSAEIIAQALVDYGLAIIVGDKQTYGKGSVQMQTTTIPNQLLSLKMTVGRFHTVSGISPQGKGVSSDIVIPTTWHTPPKKREKEFKPIASLFQDPLSDITPIQQIWYRQRYIPFLQQPTTIYRQHIPLLQKRHSSHHPATKQEQLEMGVRVLEDLIILSESTHE